MDRGAPELEPYLAAWRERLHQTRERTAAEVAIRREAAERLLPRIAETLTRQFGARRVWLVGSLARGDFDLHSDIDLAVEGLPLERWLEAERTVEALGGGEFANAIELVPLERARPRFREAVAREGRLLCDAG